MASNYFTGGSGDSITIFQKPVNLLNIFVTSGVTFSFSVDTINYITVPAGFYSVPIGPVLEVRVQATGVWQILARQS
jgi:hypothetical protein